MKTVTHRELRNDSGKILRAVAAGEAFRVTSGGQVTAVISPPGEEPLDRLKTLGQARPARRPITDLSLIRRRRAARASAELVADAQGRW